LEGKQQRRLKEMSWWIARLVEVRVLDGKWEGGLKEKNDECGLR
jgi:hypothetical protein